MKTNRFLNIKVALLIVVSVLLPACSVEEAETSVEPKDEKLSVEESIQLMADQTEQSFAVKSDVGWSVSIEGGWQGLSVSPTSGTGDAQVTIHTDANTTRQGREAVISINTNGGVNQKMVVKQALSDVILDIAGGDGQVLQYDATAEDSKNFSFSCNTTWEITTTESWIHCSEQSGGQDVSTTVGTTVGVTVDEIQTDVTREALIIISAEKGAKTKQVTVKQTGKKIELSVSPKNFEVKAAGEEKTLQITCNADWKIVYDNELFLCDVTSGTGNQDVKIICQPNSQNKERTVSLSVTSGIEDIKEETISFVQEPGTPPVLGEFSLVANSVKKNEATFKLKFDTMFPIGEYGVYYSEYSNLNSPLKASAVNTASGINELEFTLTGLKSMTTYYVYGFVQNSVGSSDSKSTYVVEITTGGVKPSGDDNPTPNLVRRK